MSGAGKFLDELLTKYPPGGHGAPALTWENLIVQHKLHDISSQLQEMFVSQSHDLVD
ncbi:hypothetical protein EUX98_g9421 [Antrodiella citrinella]|nr:hypothetical protein EUX98_g9421 [Antrodiella citrinella]